MLDRLVALLRDFETRLNRQPTFGWAVVTSVSPLQIQYDAQAEPIAGVPDTIVSGLSVGMRVWCMRIFRRDVVIGAARGGDTGWQVIPFTPEPGVTGTINGMVKNGLVTLTGELFGSIQAGTYVYATISNPLFLPPSGPRPLRGAGFLNGGFSGTSYIQPWGAIGMSQQTGATRTSMQFSFVFPAN